MSTIKVNAIQNTSGVEQYLCKAWVNFNGTGTVNIRASGNVSSITDHGIGDYTINTSSALQDVNFAFLVSATDDNIAARFGFETGTYGQHRTTSSLRFRITNDAGALNDAQGVYAAVIR